MRAFAIAGAAVLGFSGPAAAYCEFNGYVYDTYSQVCMNGSVHTCTTGGFWSSAGGAYCTSSFGATGDIAAQFKAGAFENADGVQIEETKPVRKADEN